MLSESDELKNSFTQKINCNSPTENKSIQILQYISLEKLIISYTFNLSFHIF